MGRHSCRLCPRNCGVDRRTALGVCGQSDEIRAARAALHMWEEPCISGTSGSGTVFFSGCQLHCVFCQNYNIANGSAGKNISVERLGEIFLELQQKNANNINLVTPDLFVPQIVDALGLAKKRGLQIPVVYNTSAYVRVDTLRRLEGLVDIYLPDLKFYHPQVGRRYANAPDYFQAASEAIAEMYRQAPRAEFVVCRRNGKKEKVMSKGVIVRHLLLPDGLEDSKKILDYLWNTYGNRIYYSLLSQYTPVGHLELFPELQRKVTSAEYEELVDYAVSLGVENGFIQQGEAADESFIPEFDGYGIS